MGFAQHSCMPAAEFIRWVSRVCKVYCYVHCSSLNDIMMCTCLHKHCSGHSEVETKDAD